MAIAVVLTGCGDTGGPSQLDWPLTTFMTLDANFPPGWWDLTADGDELFLTTPTGARFPIGEILNDENGRLELGPDPDCGGAIEGGVYEWKGTDGSFALTAIEDDGCPDRQEVLTGGAWDPTTSPPLIDDLPEPDPAPVVATIPLPGPPARFAVDEGSIWVSVQDDPNVYRIDPGTNAVAGTVSTGSYSDEYRWLASGEDSLWVALTNEDTLSRIDTGTGAETRIAVDSSPTSTLAAHDAVWVSQHRAGRVTRVDPDTNAVTDTITVSEPGPGGPAMLAAVDGAVHVVAPRTSEIRRIDAETLAVVTVYSGRTLGGIAVSDAGTWIVEGFDADWVTRVGDKGSRDLLVGVGEGRRPREMVATGDALWVLTVGTETPSSRAELLRVDARTGEVTSRYDLQYDVAADSPALLNLALGADGDVWVTTEGGVSRIDVSGTE